MDYYQDRKIEQLEKKLVKSNMQIKELKAKIKIILSTKIDQMGTTIAEEYGFDQK